MIDPDSCVVDIGLDNASVCWYSTLDRFVDTFRILAAITLPAKPDRLLASARRKAALLRLAVLLHRAQDPDAIPRLDLVAKDDALQLTVDGKWLEERPLLRADLASEVGDMVGLGIVFEVVSGG